MNDIPSGSAEQDLDTSDFLREVKSSTCLLLPTTPSPTPIDFKHPLSEEITDTNFMTINGESNQQNMDASAGDSSSSGDSNSVVQDPVSAQLINNISMLDYQSLSKNGDLVMGDVPEKLNGNLTTNKKLPNFVNWNWSLIRKMLLWVVLSALIACIAAIIAMIVTIPKDCNPDLPWYQGKVFYEVFPASFEDTDNNGIGDFKGIINQLDYIEKLGVSAIRLNSIFDAERYPEGYTNVTSLTVNDEGLGLLKDFEDLVLAVHERGMALILDLPVSSMAPLSPVNKNDTHKVLLANDPTSEAIAYWALKLNVDGFYLKNLENFVLDSNFGKSLQLWKQIIGNNKTFIASYEAYKKAQDETLNILLSRVDLVDVHIDINKGISGLKSQINEVINSPLWSKPHYPWVHWNIGSIKSERISTRHINNTLALTVLESVLPGTISIFYGDEIGLGDFKSTKTDNDNALRNVGHMIFPNRNAEPQNSTYDWKPNYNNLDVIESVIKLRSNTPTIYLNGIFKEGSILKNFEIRNTQENLVVIERWYPRRNTCVFVGNLGSRSISTDLSSMFYGGTVVAATNTTLVGQILYFEQVTFPPNSAVILKLEK